MDGYALGLDNGGADVVALSMADGPPDWRILGNPLQESECLAGENGVVAITGRNNGEPAVALYRKGRWQTIMLPTSRSKLDLVVRNGLVLVSAPEESRIERTADNAILRAAGAVYVVAFRGERWELVERIVASAPRKRALFGYMVQVIADYVYINYLADAPNVSDEYFGDPMVCYVRIGTSSQK